MQKNTIAKAIALIGVVGWSQAAFAADAPDANTKVVITGSNIKRTSTEGASPIQVLSKKDIQQSGAVTVADLMKNLPSMGSSGQVDMRDGGFSKGAATASMRGLGSASTLVLLNGRRIAPGAYADPNSGQSTQYDLNSMPLSAIERVEILKDGASSVYGSDAIAGVINFITRKDFTGGEISGDMSANIKGKFGRRSLNGVFGFGDLETSRFNALVSFDLSQKDSTPISEATANKRNEYMLMNGRLSNYWSAISEYPVYYRESTPGSGNFNTYHSADLSCAPSRLLTGTRSGPGAQVPLIAALLAGKQFCNYDGWQHEVSQGKSDSANLLGRVDFKLSDSLAAFGEFAYSRSELEYAGAPRSMSGRFPSTAFPQYGAGTLFQPILPIGHPDNPTNGTAKPQRVAVTYRFTDTKGGSLNENTATRLLGGLKGTFANWDWDAGLMYSESARHQVMNGFIHLPTIEKLYKNNVRLAEITKDPGVTRNVNLDGESIITQFDLKGATELGKLDGGVIGLALGMEAKQEKMSLRPDQLTIKGEIVGLANQYSEAKRNVNSAFIELRTPFTKNFEMEFAGRYDKYQGFGASFTPKVGAKWSPMPSLAVRGTYSTGFRAPSLTQMVNGGTQYFDTVEDPVRCDKPGGETTDCSKSISGVASSNPDLEPEKSKSFTLGLVLSPTSDLDILLDLYRIKKDKEVDLLTSVQVINDPKWAANVVRDQNTGTWLTDASGKLIPNSGPLISVGAPYINAGSTDTSGIDFEVALRNSLGAYGKLATRFSGSYMLSFKKEQNVGDPAYDLVGTTGYNSNDLTGVNELPRWKMSLTNTWTYNAHSLTANISYVSGVSQMQRYTIQDDGKLGPNPTPFCQFGRTGSNPDYLKFYPNCEVNSWTTMDLAYSYTASKHLTFGLNIKNVFNTEAPYDPNFGTGGVNGTLHDAKGRMFTLKANYKF